MPLLPRTHPLFKTRARRVGCYAATALTAASIFDYTNYNVLSRSMRTLVGGAYIVYLYKLTTPKDLHELNELHAEAARTVRDVCLTNEGLYIKLGQLISSMNSAVPPIVIDILKVLLDDAPKIDIDVVRATIEKELKNRSSNQERWLARQDERLAERERLRLSKRSTAGDASAPIPEVVLFNNLKAYREQQKSQQQHQGEGGVKSTANNTINDNAAAAAAAAAAPADYGCPAPPAALAPYFLAFDEQPVASASIAQVHKAVIRDPITGNPIDVAVKILKPAIRTQIWYDCNCHTLLTHAIEKLFHIPITHNNETIDRNLTRESDFYVEAAHTDLLRECLKDKKDVYIPRVFYEYLTDQVMVTEWVDAVKLSEDEKVKTQILQKGIATSKSLMTSLINAFSEMVFVHGAVNCDPHPANLMIRPHPQHPDTIREKKARLTAEGNLSAVAALPTPDLRVPRHQLILLDHGLCVTISDTFRYEYGLFFRSLLGKDTDEIAKLVTRWGVADTDLFIAMTLQRPFSSKKKKEGEAEEGDANAPKKVTTPPPSSPSLLGDTRQRKYSIEELAEMQQMMKDRLSKFLADDELMPKEMLFIGRSFNYLRSINKSFGAPVNRLKMTVDCAFGTLDKARIDNLSDLVLWEKCGRNQSAYLAMRRSMQLDTFATEVHHWRRKLSLQCTLYLMEMYQIATVFYNTVIVPNIIVPSGDEARMKAWRMGTMEDMLEAKEAQMSDQMWGPGGTGHENAPFAHHEERGGGGGKGGAANIVDAKGNVVKMDFVPDIGVND